MGLLGKDIFKFRIGLLKSKSPELTRKLLKITRLETVTYHGRFQFLDTDYGFLEEQEVAEIVDDDDNKSKVIVQIGIIY